MSELQQFEIVGDHAEYRPTGEVSLAQAGQLVTSAIAFAREQHVRRLLVVMTGLTGYRPPDAIDHYSLIHEGARASGHVVRVAVVPHPEMMDPHKFEATVAANCGFARPFCVGSEAQQLGGK